MLYVGVKFFILSMQSMKQSIKSMFCGQKIAWTWLELKKIVASNFEEEKKAKNGKKDRGQAGEMYRRRGPKSVSNFNNVSQGMSKLRLED
jgi:hypothetical protein